MTRAEREVLPSLPSLQRRPQERRCSLLGRLGGGGEAQGWERGGQEQRGRRLGSGVAWTARSWDSKAGWSEPNSGGALSQPCHRPAHSASPATPRLAGLGEDMAEPGSLDVRVSSLLQRSLASWGPPGRGWHEGQKARGQPQAQPGLRTEPPAAVEQKRGVRLGPAPRTAGWAWRRREEGSGRWRVGERAWRRPAGPGCLMVF